MLLTQAHQLQLGEGNFCGFTNVLFQQQSINYGLIIVADCIDYWIEKAILAMFCIVKKKPTKHMISLNNNKNEQTDHMM